MTVTQAEIDKLRRMVAEPTTTTYTDATISGYIADNDNDLNGAAYEIMVEKIAGLQATQFDFKTEGESYSKIQVVETAEKLAKNFAAHRLPRVSLWVKSPEEEDTSDDLQEG